MSFETIVEAQSSTQDSSMVDCYRLVNLSTGEIHRFTSSSTPIALQQDSGVKLYTPAHITRGSIQYTAKTHLATMTLKMTIPLTDTLFTSNFRQNFTGSFPASLFEIDLVRAQRVTERSDEAIAAEHADRLDTDATFDGTNLEISMPWTPSSLQKKVWQGTLSSANFTHDDVLELNLSAVGDQSTRPVPGRKYSWACGHVWGDSNCGLDITLYQSDAYVADVQNTGYRVVLHADSTGTSPAVDFATALAGSDEYFSGGYLQLDGDPSNQRMILGAGNDGSNYYVDVSIPLFTVTEGTGNTIINLFAGCSRDPGTCRDKFDNLPQFGGFPHVPDFNPFSSGVAVPEFTVLPSVVAADPDAPPP